MDRELLDKITEWIAAGKLRHEEMWEIFYDTREGAFLKTLERWCRNRQLLLRSDGAVTREERVGRWTLKWLAEGKEKEVKYQQVHSKLRVMKKLKDDFALQHDPALNPESLLAYVPANICAFTTHRFSPVTQTVPKWWIDCAVIPDAQQDEGPINLLEPIPVLYFPVLTIEMHYSLSGEAKLEWTDNPNDDTETILVEPRDPSYSKVIVALALHKTSEKLLTREAAEKLCYKEPPFPLHF
jgi:hypothetical protein